MAKKKQIIFPSEKKILLEFGERLRLARLRRGMSADTLAARSRISRMTLHRAEKGSPGVALGTYMRMLVALHLETDINLLAKDDVLGRKLQDLGLPQPRPRRKLVDLMAEMPEGLPDVEGWEWDDEAIR